MPAIATESFKESRPALKTLGEKLAQLSGLLEKQAERSEGLDNCWQRTQALAQQLKQWQTGDEADQVQLAGGIPPFAATQHHTAVHRRDLREADSRQCARMDIHVRHARGKTGFFALSK